MIELLKKINMMNEKEEVSLVEDFLLHSNKFNAEDKFSVFLSLRTYFFRYMTKSQKKKYCVILLEYIKNGGETSYSIIEMLGIFYKYFDKEEKTKIFDEILKNRQCTYSNRESMALILFIKNSFRVYSGEQMKVCHYFLEKYQTMCLEETKEAFQYLRECMEKEFKPKSKTLFLVPEYLSGLSFLQPPIELINAKKLLHDNNYQVDFLDNRGYSYSQKQIGDIAEEYETVVVFSSTTDQHLTYFVDYRYVVFCSTVNTIHKRNKRINIVVCGAHGTLKPEYVFRDCNCDLIIRGEIDYQLPNYLLESSNSDTRLNTDNIVYKENGEIFYTNVNEEKLHPENWGEYSSNYSDIDLAFYYGYKYSGNVHLIKKNWSIVQTTRGCPYKCLFCHNFYGHKVRYRNIKYVIEEMRMLEDRGIKEVFFMDQTFSLNKEYVINLCENICNSNIHIQWYCQTRVGLIDDEIASVMKKAGCIGVWIGIESVNKRVLELNKKGYCKEELLQTIEVFDKNELEYNAFIMLGMVGDTQESIRETVEFIEDNNIKLTKSIMICTPRFGAEMYDYLIKETGTEVDDFLKLDSFKGIISNQVESADLNLYLNRLIKYVNKN